MWGTGIIDIDENSSVTTIEDAISFLQLPANVLVGIDEAQALFSLPES